MEIGRAEKDMAALILCNGIKGTDSDEVNIHKSALKGHFFRAEVEVEVGVSQNYPQPFTQTDVRRYYVRSHYILKSMRDQIKSQFDGLRGNSGLQVLCTPAILNDVLEAWKRAAMVFLDNQVIESPSLVTTLVELGYLVVTKYPHYIDPSYPWIFLDVRRPPEHQSFICCDGNCKNWTGQNNIHPLETLLYNATLLDWRTRAQSLHLAFFIDSFVLEEFGPRAKPDAVRKLIQVCYHGSREVQFHRIHLPKPPAGEGRATVRKISLFYDKLATFTNSWGDELSGIARTPTIPESEGKGTVSTSPCL